MELFYISIQRWLRCSSILSFDWNCCHETGDMLATSTNTANNKKQHSRTPQLERFLKTGSACGFQGTWNATQTSKSNKQHKKRKEMKRKSACNRRVCVKNDMFCYMIIIIELPSRSYSSSFTPPTSTEFIENTLPIKYIWDVKENWNEWRGGNGIGLGMRMFVVNVFGEGEYEMMISNKWWRIRELTTIDTFNSI